MSKRCWKYRNISTNWKTYRTQSEMEEHKQWTIHDPNLTKVGTKLAFSRSFSFVFKRNNPYVFSSFPNQVRPISCGCLGLWPMATKNKCTKRTTQCRISFEKSIHRQHDAKSIVFMLLFRSFCLFCLKFKVWDLTSCQRDCWSSAVWRINKCTHIHTLGRNCLNAIYELRTWYWNCIMLNE